MFHAPGFFCYKLYILFCLRSLTIIEYFISDGGISNCRAQVTPWRGVRDTMWRMRVAESNAASCHVTLPSRGVLRRGCGSWKRRKQTAVSRFVRKSRQTFCVGCLLSLRIPQTLLLSKRVPKLCAFNAEVKRDGTALLFSPHDDSVRTLFPKSVLAVPSLIFEHRQLASLFFNLS